jgi:hypothetical protein
MLRRPSNTFSWSPSSCGAAHEDRTFALRRVVANTSGHVSPAMLAGIQNPCPVRQVWTPPDRANCRALECSAIRSGRPAAGLRRPSSRQASSVLLSMVGCRTGSASPVCSIRRCSGRTSTGCLDWRNEGPIIRNDGVGGSTQDVRDHADRLTFHRFCFLNSLRNLAVFSPEIMNTPSPR